MFENVLAWKSKKVPIDTSFPDPKNRDTNRFVDSSWKSCLESKSVLSSLTGSLTEKRGFQGAGCNWWSRSRAFGGPFLSSVLQYAYHIIIQARTMSQKCDMYIVCTVYLFFPFHIELIDLFIFTVYMNLDIYGSYTGQLLDTTTWAWYLLLPWTNPLCEPTRSFVFI